MTHRVSRWIEQRSRRVIVVLTLATCAMMVPLIWMQPTSFASQEPPGEVFEARDRMEESFSSGRHRWVYLVEAVRGNLLERAPLLELLENSRSMDDAEVSSIADAVDGALGGGLQGATEAEVAAAVDRVLDTVGPDAFGLAMETERTDHWRTPALILPVLAEEEAVGGSPEVFARGLLEQLRGKQRHIRVWGIAIDAGLTSLEQGRAAGPFIGMTVCAVLLVVGLTFRSYWTVSVVGFALTALIIWLKGASNLMGLKSDQILSTIVPIAMISFGVDFAFHAIGRYREERGGFAAGLAGVLGALLVAMMSDAAAFLSNTTSDIEVLVQFGVAAAVATVVSFVMLGIFSPLLLMEIERRVPPRGGIILSLAGSLFCSLGAMVAVTLTVFVSPALGAAAFGVYGVIFLLIPLGFGMRRTGGPPLRDGGKGMPRSDIFERLGGLVVALARKRAIVLPLAALVTAGAAYLASRLETRFDVRDFFAPDTDFVVGLEKFDKHVGERGGEPASIYIEGRLADPGSLDAIRAFQEELLALETDRLARDSEGRIIVEGPRMETGGDPRAASITVRLPGSRALENVREAREALAPLVTRLEGRLAGVDPDARAILTGQPIVRLEGIEAITRAFRRSLPVAVVLCLGIATLFMRSFRYALISCIPILIVVLWLHAFMQVAGYSLNVVTATLGAISIGIGIDFSIHFTMRYREESLRRGSGMEAMAVAGAGTGGALLASAASSIIGFSILAFAPMPLFASYGLLTAVMVALAGGVSLFVLPSLLRLLDPAGGDHRD